MSADMIVSGFLGPSSGCFRKYLQEESRWHFLRNSHTWNRLSAAECRRLITRYSVVYTTMLQSWFAHVTVHLKNPAAIEAVKAYSKPSQVPSRYDIVAQVAASAGISPSPEECASMQKAVDAMSRLFSGPQYEFSGLAALCLMDMAVEDYWIILLVAAQESRVSEASLVALQRHLEEVVRRVWILEKALMLEVGHPGHIDVDLTLECGLQTALVLLKSVFVDTIPGT